MNREAACEAQGESCARLYAVEEELRELVAAVEKHVRHRDSGFGIDLNDLSPLEYEGLLIWDTCVEAHRTEMERRTAELYRIAVGVLSRR